MLAVPLRVCRESTRVASLDDVETAEQNSDDDEEQTRCESSSEKADDAADDQGDADYPDDRDDRASHDDRQHLREYDSVHGFSIFLGKIFWYSRTRLGEGPIN